MEETDSVAARLKRELLNVKGVSEVNISRSDYQPNTRWTSTARSWRFTD